MQGLLDHRSDTAAIDRLLTDERTVRAVLDGRGLLHLDGSGFVAKPLGHWGGYVAWHHGDRYDQPAEERLLRCFAGHCRVDNLNRALARSPGRQKCGDLVTTFGVERGEHRYLVQVGSGPISEIGVRVFHGAASDASFELSSPVTALAPLAFIQQSDEAACWRVTWKGSFRDVSIRPAEQGLVLETPEGKVPLAFDGHHRLVALTLP